MTRQRVLGAIRYPVFLIVWTAAVVALTAQLQAADAAAVGGDPSTRAAPFAAAALEPAPDFRAGDGWREAVAQAMKDTGVVSGAWQPRRGGPAPAIAPDLRLVPLGPPAAEDANGLTADAVDARVVSRESAAAPGWKTPASGDPAWRRPAPVRKAVADRGLAQDKAAARTALRAGRFAEAYALLRPAVAEAGRDPEFLGLLALAAVRTGSDGEALVLYRHLADLEPQRDRWRVGLALARQRLGLELDDAGAESLAALGGTAAGAGGDLG